MTLSPTPVRPPAEAALIDAFGALRARGVSPAREAAFARFAGRGLPSRRIEAWHYTDLRTLLKGAPTAVASPAPASVAGSAFQLGGGRDLVFSAGSLVDAGRAPAGVTITRDEVARTLAQPVIDEADSTVALTRAFAQEVVSIHVAAGVDAGALHLAFRSDGSACVSAAHVVVVVGAGASVTVVESHESAVGEGHIAQALVEFDVGQGGAARHVRVNALAPEASSLSTLGVDLSADARFDTVSLTTGAGVSRHQVFLRFSGENARAGVRGATLVRGRQHADTTLVVNHAAAHCDSRETFKNIVDGDAASVFQGRINVAAGAQKTDARMSSNALLLSDGAAMYNKPELEIFADDVQCAHGATCGELDESLLFYIMARGLPRREAEALLLEAFVADAFEGLDESMSELLMERVRGWLAQRAP